MRRRKPNPVIILVLTALLLFIALPDAAQATGGSPITTVTASNMTIARPNQVLAMEYEYHALEFNWSIPGTVNPGDYFTVKLDPELNLHPNTNEQLPDFYQNGKLIATISADSAAGTITYTFTNDVVGLSNFSGSLMVNVSVKPPDSPTKDVTGDGKSDIDGYGNYKAGTVQPLRITVGTQTTTLYVTHLAYPTVPESIYNVNSWFNTTVIEHSVIWNPAITGNFIQAFIEVTNNAQFQTKPLTANPPARDIVITQYVDQTVSPFVLSAGIKVTESDGVYDPATNRIIYTTGPQNAPVRYFTFEQLGYDPGSGVFTFDFAKWGYENPKPPNRRYTIEFFIEHLPGSQIPYSKPDGTPNNMAYITYIADPDYNLDPTDKTITFRDGAFWYITRSFADADAGTGPLFSFFTVGITKDWVNPPADVPGIQFKLYGNGNPAQWYNWTTQRFETVPDSALYLAPGQESLIIRNLRYREGPANALVQYTMEEVRIDGYESIEERIGMQFHYTNTYHETSKTVNKIWMDGVRPIPSDFKYPAVKLQLMRDGLPYLEPVYVNGVIDGSASTEPPLLTNGSGETQPWIYQWEGLPERKYKDDGTYTLYTYTVTEPEVPPHFVNTVDADGNMVNTYQSGAFTASKYWSGVAPDKPLPAVTLQLWRGERDNLNAPMIQVDFGTVDGVIDNVPADQPGEKTPWAYTWYDLPADDGNGVLYQYEVREAGNNFGYLIDEVTSASVRVVNVAQTIDLKVNKIWKGIPTGQAPTARFQLKRSYQSGTQTITQNVGTAVTLNSQTPSYIWPGQPRFVTWDPALSESQQNAYTYWVTEYPVPNYSTEISSDGWTFTNTYVPAIGTIRATKDWYIENIGSDYPNPTHELVYLRLFRKVAGGQEEAVPLTEAPLIELPIDFPDHTEVAWEGISLKNTAGSPYTFRVKEVNAAGNDWMPDNYIKTETGTAVTNTMITEESRRAGITIVKDLIDNSGMNGGNAPSIAVEGSPLVFRFHISGPYGYERDVFVKAGEKLVLEQEMLYGTYTITETTTHGYQPTPKTHTLTLIRMVPHLQASFINGHPDNPANDANAVVVRASKIWKGGPYSDHTAPTLTISRKAGGSDWQLVTDAVYTVTPADDRGTQFDYVWSNLPKHDPRGFTYSYRVDEMNVVDNEVEINGNLYTVSREGNVITNAYASSYSPISVSLTAKKELKGRALEAGAYTFVLKDWSKKEIERVTNAADGSIPLSSRRFSRTGSFLYTLEEVDGGKGDIVYDKSVYTIRVNVTDENGRLVADVAYIKDGVPQNSVHFVSAYKPPKTGDLSANRLMALLTLALLFGGAAVLLKRREE